MRLVSIESLLALWPFVLTCFVVELTPGPNMGFLAVLSLGRGRRAGLAAVAGVALGLAIVGIAAAIGLAAIISASPLAWQVLRWAGVGYLLWLAWETWRDGGGPDNLDVDGPASDTTYFVRGLVTNLLNPKAAVFYVAILPLHIDPARALVLQSVLLSLIYVAIATAIHAVIVLLAAQLKPIVERAGASRLVHAVLALMLVGVAVWLVIATRR